MEILLLIDEWSMVAEKLTTIKVQHWVNGQLEVDWGDLRKCDWEVGDGRKVHDVVKTAAMNLDAREFIEIDGNRNNLEIVRLLERGEKEVARWKRSDVFEPIQRFADKAGLEYGNVIAALISIFTTVLGVVLGFILGRMS